MLSIARNNTKIINYTDDTTVIGYCKNWLTTKLQLQEQQRQIDGMIQW